MAVVTQAIWLCMYCYTPPAVTATISVLLWLYMQVHNENWRSSGGKFCVFDLIICDLSGPLFMNIDVFELVSILRTGKCYSPIFSRRTFFNSSLKRIVCNLSYCPFLHRLPTKETENQRCACCNWCSVTTYSTVQIFTVLSFHGLQTEGYSKLT